MHVCVCMCARVCVCVCVCGECACVHDTGIKTDLGVSLPVTTQTKHYKYKKKSQYEKQYLNYYFVYLR